MLSKYSFCRKSGSEPCDILWGSLLVNGNRMYDSGAVAAPEPQFESAGPRRNKMIHFGFHTCISCTHGTGGMAKGLDGNDRALTHFCKIGQHIATTTAVRPVNGKLHWLIHTSCGRPFYFRKRPGIQNYFTVHILFTRDAERNK